MVVVGAIRIFLHQKNSLYIPNSLILDRDDGFNDNNNNNNNFQNEYQLDMLSNDISFVLFKHFLANLMCASLRSERQRKFA